MNFNQLFLLPENELVDFMGHKITITRASRDEDIRSLKFLIGNNTFVTIVETSSFFKGKGEFYYTVTIRNNNNDNLPAINRIVKFVTHEEPVWNNDRERMLFFVSNPFREGNKINLFTRELGCQVCQTTPAQFKEETDFSKRFCGLKCQKEFYQ